MEILLDFATLHLWVDAEARIGLYRLKFRDIENVVSQGYTDLNFSRGILLNDVYDMGLGKMIPRRVGETKFTLTILE